MNPSTQHENEKPPRLAHPARLSRKRQLWAALKADPALSLTEASQRFGLSPLTVGQYAISAGISIAGRGERVPFRSRNPARDALWITRYKSGERLREIAASEGVSFERVRQIIVRHEIWTGEKIVRHGQQGGLRVERVVWHCEVCGEERHVTPTVRDHYLSTRCGRCKKVDVVQIEQDIALRRQYGNWHAASKASGRYSPTSAAMTRHVYRYLLHMGRDAEIAELWPRGIPPWLQKIYRDR